MSNDQISIFNSDSLPGEEFFRGLLSGVTEMGVLKWMMVGGLVMYILFAAVIIQQVAIMTETLEEDANGLIRIFAWAHLLMAIFIAVVLVVWL